MTCMRSLPHEDHVPEVTLIERSPKAVPQVPVRTSDSGIKITSLDGFIEFTNVRQVVSNNNDGTLGLFEADN